MGQLLDAVLGGEDMGDLEDLHARRNAKALVTLRGHRLDSRTGKHGLYLGKMRDNFPGTDGLDRASSATGVEWLQRNGFEEFRFIVGEGATLATRPFLSELAARTELLLLHLWADDFVKDLRFTERGSEQDPRFVEATATRSANLLQDMGVRAAKALSIDSASPEEWEDSLTVCLDWIL
jgi:hypothetical protein